MRLRQLFMLNIFLAAFFGVSCTFFPAFVFRLYGVAANDNANWAARLAGGSILAFGTLMWFGWKSASIEARRAIALALFVQDAIGCAASYIFQVTGKVNAFGWFSLLLYGVLAYAYAYFALVRPKTV